MEQLSHIGLDVHKDTIAVAVLRPGATEVDERTIPDTPEAIRKLLRPYQDPSTLRVCYEAGPTGYDTHRLITSLGHTCAVIAPSLIPRRAGVRVKTDRTDARIAAPHAGGWQSGFIRRSSGRSSQFPRPSGYPQVCPRLAR